MEKLNSFFISLDLMKPITNNMIKWKKNIGVQTMAKFLKTILIFLGGLVIMTACSKPEEKIPNNRTKEQYELEQEFSFIRNILIEKKFSNVQFENMSYTKKISSNINSKEGSILDFGYTINLNKDLKGNVDLEQNGQNVSFDVTYSGEKLTSKTEKLKNVSFIFDELSFSQKQFDELKISETLDHSETDIQEIYYSEDYNSVNAKKIIKDNNLSDDTKITMSFKKVSEVKNITKYNFNYVIVDKISNKRIEYRLFVWRNNK